MQKWKVTLPVLLILGFVSSALNAETPTPVGGTPPKVGEMNALPAPVQEHMIEMMQDDFSFQNEKRALSNQLELETLRSAIQKVKGIPLTVPETTVKMEMPREAAAVEKKIDTVTPLPKILLISEIGGISRVAISSDNVVKLVRANEKFTLNGHSFIVFNTSKNTPAIKEVF